MKSFKEFYQRLQEEKLLKANKSTDKGIRKPSEIKNGDNCLMSVSKNESDRENGVLKKQCGARDNELQQVKDKIEETVNYTTKMLTQYPTGPIQISNQRLIKSPKSLNISDTFGYDVKIGPQNKIFAFLKEETLFQLNDQGIMRFKTTWDEESVRKEIKKVAKKKDSEDEAKLERMVQYIQSQNKAERDVSKEFLKNFNQYYLFWKFEDQMTGTEDENEKASLEKKIADLKIKPSEEDFDGYVRSQEFYNTINKMDSQFTANDANRVLQVLSIIEEERTTYFYPTLIDIIRIYDECETSVKELPTVILKKIDSNDEENPLVNESLYTDVLQSLHRQRDDRGNIIAGSSKKPYAETNPENVEIFTNDFGKDLGEIVYEFVSVHSGNWNRITDKGVMIGYKDKPSFTSLDIGTCFIMAYCDIVDTLKESPKFNSKYLDPAIVPIWLLKVGLENVVSGKIAADHPGALKQGKPNTRRFNP